MRNRKNWAQQQWQASNNLVAATHSRVIANMKLRDLLVKYAWQNKTSYPVNAGYCRAGFGYSGARRLPAGSAQLRAFDSDNDT